MKSSQYIIESPDDIFNDPGRAALVNLPKGAIAFSNTSRFDASAYDQGLTEYTTSYEDPDDVWGMVEKCCPGVGVEPRFNFKKHDSSAAFLMEVDDTRAVGQRTFKRVEVLGTEVEARTFSRGLTMMVEKDELDSIPDVLKTRAGYLKQRLGRNELSRFITLADTAATTAPLVWSKLTPDPDNDIYDALDISQQEDGIWKNTAIYGGQAWFFRRGAFRAQSTAGAIASAQFDEDDLARNLRLRNCVVADNVRQLTSKIKTRFFGPAVYLYYAYSGMMKDDPSDFKRFWSAVGARGGSKGSQLAVYVQEHSFGVDLTVHHRSVTYVTSGNTIIKRTIS
jgi:hypothetical protein